MKKFFNFLIGFCLFANTLTLKPSPTETYPNELVLQSPDSYFLYWKHDNEKITFEIHFKNSAWALFGLSGSSFSDVIVGWVKDDKTGHFSDRKLSSQNILTFDSQTNWIPLDAFRKDEFTVLKFSRNIKVGCENSSSSLEDLEISEGNVNLVFKTGNSYNPKDDSINLEGSPNQVQVNLLKTPGPFKCPVVQQVPYLDSTPTGIYSSSFELIEGVYKIFWNHTDTDVVVEIHCKTQGWVAFGLSPTGGMDKSDVVVGWISNGITNFTDRFIYGKEVRIDKSQDWKLLYSAEKNGITILKFTRPIKLCDTEDRIIEEGTPYVIYAFGLNDPAPGQDIGYHLSNRGSKKLNFISEIQVKSELIEKDNELVEFELANVVLPRVDTYYYCKGFEVPKRLSEKRHIIKWEIVLPKLNYKNMHHALVYECTPGYNGTNPEYKDGNCYTDEIKKEYCKAISLGWAVGGETVSLFLSDTGYPIGGQTDYSYFILEMHYDNPDLEIGFIDKVTLKYYVTKNLRKNELGIFTVGTDSSAYGIAIPPGLPYFSIRTYCSLQCMGKKLANQNMTIISANPHTHLAGVDLWTKIIRKGVDIGYLYRNKYYDFNFQNTYELKPYITLTKDDELITQCGYQTKDRKSFTLGGESTRNEMCFQFFSYYPRNNDFKACLSMPDMRDYNDLLLDLNRTGHFNLSRGNGDFVEDFFQYMDEAYSKFDISKSDDHLRDRYSSFYNNTRLYEICDMDGYAMEKKPQILKEYVEVDVCANKTTNPLVSILNHVTTFFKNIFYYLFGWLF